MLMIGAALPVPLAGADSVYLKNGRVIHTSDARVEGDRVVIALYGSTQIIPLSLIDRIEENDRGGPGESNATRSPSTPAASPGSAASAPSGSPTVGGLGTPAERMRAFTGMLEQSGAGSAEATRALELLQSLGGAGGAGVGDIAAQLGGLGALGGELGNLGNELGQVQTILPLLAQLGAALFAPEFSPEASADAVQNLLVGLRSMGVSQAQIEAEARRLGLPPEILEQIRRR